jgi:hypothetical protein
MTIYAVFLCVIGTSICEPTAFKNDRTAEACEVHRQYMESFTKGAAFKSKAVCMKKTVPTWEPVR